AASGPIGRRMPPLPSGQASVLPHLPYSTARAPVACVCDGAEKIFDIPCDRTYDALLARLFCHHTRCRHSGARDRRAASLVTFRSYMAVSGTLGGVLCAFFLC